MSESYCTFRLGRYLLGVEVTRVREIKRRDRVTPVPLAPPCVHGLVNLRGQIITALDLATRLGVEPGASARRTMVIVQGREGPVSLLVDGVGDVIAPPDRDCEAPPATIDESVRPFLRSVAKLDHEVLSVLDTDRVVDLGFHAGAGERG